MALETLTTSRRMYGATIFTAQHVLPLAPWAISLLSNINQMKNQRQQLAVNFTLAFIEGAVSYWQ